MIITGSWADFLTSGHYVVLDGDVIRTWDPAKVIPLPTPESLLFLRLTVTNGFKVIGKGQISGKAWMWTDADQQWHDLGPTSNNQPVAFDNDGLPFIAPASFGSQGIRYFDEHNQPVTGDDTYNEERRVARELGITQLWEYTHLGGITVGQGINPDGVHVIFDDDPTRAHRLVIPGNTRFVHLDWDRGDGFAISTTLLGTNTCAILWYTRAALRALPVVGAPVVIPPKEPTVPAFPFPPGFDPVPALQSFRSTLRTPIQVPGVYDDRPALLIGSCKIVGHGAGLLKKDGGTHTTLPDGTNVSQDWMEFDNGAALDFIADGEDTARIQWSAAKESQGPRVDVTKFFDQVPVDPVDPGKPDTTAPAQLTGLSDSIVAQMDVKFPGASKGYDDSRRAHVTRIAEQLAFSVDPKFGVKRAAADRPSSRNAIGYNVTPLVGYILYTDPGGDRIPAPKVASMAGQVFEAVVPQDHLGLGKPGDPGGPGGPGGPTDPPDLTALRAEISQLRGQVAGNTSTIASLATRIAVLEDAQPGTPPTTGPATEATQQQILATLKQILAKAGG